MIRKHDKPLQQIIRRCNERNFIERKILEQNLINCEQLKHKHTDGPLLENLIEVQYKKLYFKNIKTKVGDNANSFILNDSNDIIKVENIISLNKTNEIFIIGKVFEVKKAFYEKPIPSTLLNIYVVNNLSVTHKYWSYNCIKNKIMLLELNEQKIAIPVIHDIDGQ